MQLVVGTNIYIANASKSLIKIVKSKLTFTNPEWEKSKALGYSTYGKKRYICLMDIVGNDSIKIPRGYLHWLIEILDDGAYDYKIIDKSNKSEKIKFDWNKEIVLRDYQKITDLKPTRTIVIPAGGGKTITACGLIHKTEQRFIWLTHSKELMYQTQEVLEKTLNCEVGILGDGKDTIEPHHKGVVVMVQTLARREKYLENFNKRCGLLIVDEAHLFMSTMFSKVISRLNMKYIVGLTATPQRADKRDYLLTGYLGDLELLSTREVLYGTDKLTLPKLKVIYTQFTGNNAMISNKEADDLGGEGTLYHLLISKLLSDSARYMLILREIRGKLKGNCNLIVGDRLSYLKSLSKDLEIPFLHGSMSKKERAHIIEGVKNGNIDSFIATTSIVKEGLDIPRLNQLFLTCPMRGDSIGRTDGSALEQVIGRIMRYDKVRNKEAVVYDFVDYSNEIFKKQYYSRVKTYKRIGMEVPRKKREKQNVDSFLDDMF